MRMSVNFAELHRDRCPFRVTLNLCATTISYLTVILDSNE